MRDQVGKRRVAGPPPWLLWTTLAAGLVCALLQALGVLTPLDRSIHGALVHLRAAPERGEAPLLLAIDDPTLEALGSLPWSQATWARVARGLEEAGLREVTVVDPWTRLVRGEGIEAEPGGAELLVPTLLQEAATGVPEALAPPANLPPLVAWEHVLYLPTGHDGVIRDLSAAARAGDLFGPHALCQWARCPEGAPMALPVRTLEPAGALPILSLVEVVEGTRVPASTELERTVLVGVTAPFQARAVRFGNDGVPLSWPEAVGHAVATARAQRPTPVPGLTGQLSLVLAVLLGVTVLGRLVPALRTGPLAYTPAAAVAGAGLILTGTGVVLLPLTGSVLAAVLPPLVRGAASRRVALDFLGRVALLLVQDGFRYAWRDTRVRTPEDLVVVLGALARNHTTTARSAWLHRVDGGSRLELTGGYGVGREDLSTELLHLGAQPFRDGRTRPEGSDAGLLLTAGLGGRVVPLWQRRALVGFWLVVYDDDTADTDPAVLARLAGWMGLRLDLDLPSPGIRDQFVDRLGAETGLVQRLFAAASEERRRQVQALHAVDLPLLTADIAGTIQFVNHTMGATLEANHLTRHTTVRGVLFEIMEGGGGFQEQMHRLFAAGDTLRLAWSDAGDQTWRVVVQPVRDSAERKGEVLGYVMHLEDLTHLVQLREMRSSVVHFASSRVRNNLMVIAGYARLMRQVAAGDDDRSMLDAVLEQTEDITAALEELRAAGGLEDDEDQPLELDLAKLVREVVREVRPAASLRRLTVDTEVPAFSLPVVAPPTKVRTALAGLLREACAAAAPGSAVVVTVEDHAAASLVQVSWPGAGLDPSLFEALDGPWHEDLGALPAVLHPYARARHVLTDLELSSAPGQGTTAAFSLPRGRGSSAG